MAWTAVREAVLVGVPEQLARRVGRRRVVDALVPRECRRGSPRSRWVALWKWGAHELRIDEVDEIFYFF